ncbi:MAG: hypothetical protein H7328_04610 [Bdellovibrio sp.]|nr:hypothetical protein [Bdellovibrio sp.]
MKFFVFIFFFAHIKAWAFPQFISNQSTHCFQCHSSDQNGLLNSYGKNYSRNILSQSNSEYLDIQTPSWLQVGARSVFLQTFTESSQNSQAAFSIKRAEVGALLKQQVDSHEFTALATFGRYEPIAKDITFRDYAYLPEFYFNYQIVENESDLLLNVKIGRYKPNYGIAIRDYQIINEMNFGQERTQGQLSLQGAEYEFLYSRLFNRRDYNLTSSESGDLLRLSRVVKKNLLIGINSYKSNMQSFEGVFAVIQSSDELSTLLQIDQHHFDDKKGVAFFIRPEYIIQQGLKFFSALEYRNRQIETSNPHDQQISAGLQYFPYAQVDLTAVYKNTNNTNVISPDSQSLWLSVQLSM